MLSASTLKNLIWCNFILFFLTNLCQAADRFCNETKECEGESIRTDDGDGIRCVGSYSCFNGATLFVASSDGNIHCQGSYSCFKAEKIHARSTINSGDIYCSGLYSCANVIDKIQNGNEYVACSGELSCFGSTIYVEVNQGEDLFCYGDRSCSNVISYVTQESLMYGFLSGMNGIFQDHESSNGVSTIWKFKGYQSGYNARVICGNDEDECTVKCYADSCNFNLTSQCSELDSGDLDTGDCTIIYNCSMAEQSELCPYGYKRSSFSYQLEEKLYDIEVLISINGEESIVNLWDYKDVFNLDLDVYLSGIGMTSLNNSDYDNVCHSNTNSNKYICDGYRTCAGIGSISTNSDNIGGICCSGGKACVSVTNISSYANEIIDLNGIGFDYVNMFNHTVGIRCDGWKSCFGVSGLIESNNGGNIYMSGAYSSDNENIIARIRTNGNGGNVYCSGYESCLAKIIEFVDNVYCSAYESCWNATRISDIDKNVWGLGYHSLKYANINNVKGSVYCATVESCSQSIIDNINGDVYGNGYHSLSDALITNVNGSVLGLGYYALENAILINATNVFCDAENSCFGISINGITNIETNGSNSLPSATIISNIDKGKTMTVTIDGNHETAITSNIYCNVSNTCNITCLSQYSCVHINLHCFGKCNLFCTDSGEPNTCVGQLFEYNVSTTSTTFTSTTTTPTTTTTTIATTAQASTKIITTQSDTSPAPSTSPSTNPSSNITPSPISITNTDVNYNYSSNLSITSSTDKMSTTLITTTNLKRTNVDSTYTDSAKTMEIRVNETVIDDKHNDNDKDRNSRNSGLGLTEIIMIIAIVLISLIVPSIYCIFFVRRMKREKFCKKEKEKEKNTLKALKRQISPKLESIANKAKTLSPTILAHSKNRKKGGAGDNNNNNNNGMEDLNIDGDELSSRSVSAAISAPNNLTLSVQHVSTMSLESETQRDEPSGEVDSECDDNRMHNNYNDGRENINIDGADEDSQEGSIGNGNGIGSTHRIERFEGESEIIGDINRDRDRESDTASSNYSYKKRRYAGQENKNKNKNQSDNIYHDYDYNYNYDNEQDVEIGDYFQEVENQLNKIKRENETGGANGGDRSVKNAVRQLQEEFSTELMAGQALDDVVVDDILEHMKTQK